MINHAPGSHCPLVSRFWILILKPKILLNFKPKILTKVHVWHLNFLMDIFLIEWHRFDSYMSQIMLSHLWNNVFLSVMAKIASKRKKSFNDLNNIVATFDVQISQILFDNNLEHCFIYNRYTDWPLSGPHKSYFLFDNLHVCLWHNFQKVMWFHSLDSPAWIQHWSCLL